MDNSNVNPIGEVRLDDAINNYVQVVIAQWDEAKESHPWWQFWKHRSMVAVTQFLLKALDDLIAYVDEVIDTSGADKKATVLRAIEMIYDYIVRKAMPIWLKPFAERVKTIVLLDIISPAIDWIVEKYRHGEWRKPSSQELAAQWAMQAQMFGVPGGHRPK